MGPTEKPMERRNGERRKIPEGDNVVSNEMQCRSSSLKNEKSDACSRDEKISILCTAALL